MNRASLLIALLAASLPAGVSAQDGPPAALPAALHPGDRAAIQVWRTPELSGTFTVGEDSALVHPIYGEVKVAGIPLPAAQERVRQFLTRFQPDPRITFVPEFRVYVGGAVRDPNQHYLPEMTVAEAITRAGGSIAPNRTQRVRMIRGGRQTLVNLNSERITELLQQPIRSGDQIVVEERPTFSRTYLGPALTVLQAVGSIITTYVLIDQVLNSGDDPE